MTLRKSGAEKFPNELETQLEIGIGMEEGVLSAVPDSVVGILENTDSA